MKLFPHEADRAARWPLFCLFVLSLFIVLASRPAAAQKPKSEKKPIILAVTVEEGKTNRAGVRITSTCLSLYNFEVKSDFPYLRFEEPVSSIPIQPGGNKIVWAEFSAAGLKKGTYKGSLNWGCIACPTGKGGCSANRTVVQIEMTVTKAPPQRWTTLAHSDLAARFFKVIEKALDEHNARLTDGAKTLVSQMIDKGAANISGQQTAEKLEQAEANLKTFIKKAVELAKAQAGKKSVGGMSFAPASRTRAAKIELNEEIIKQTQFALCPLFPFC